MAFDFPSSPTPGQVYTTPINTAYIWDGEKWTGGATPPSSFVLKAGDTMTGALTLSGDPAAPLVAATKQYVDNRPSGAPFDALAYNGIQFNGGMEVSQELGTTTPSFGAGVKYIVDGWSDVSTGVQVVTLGQSTDAPPGYYASASMTITTANTAPATNDELAFRHRIEGYRMWRLGWGTSNALPLAIGFWVKTNRAGNYGGSVSSGGSGWSCPFAFTVNAANTWEYKTTVIPPAPVASSGYFLGGSSTGLAFLVSMMAGTASVAPAGTWLGSMAYGPTGMMNGASVVGDFMRITGVSLVPGPNVMTAAQSPLIMRPYEEELRLCQRHFYVCGSASNYIAGGGYAPTANCIYYLSMLHPVPMRINAVTFTRNGNWNVTNCGQPQTFGANAQGFTYTVQPPAIGAFTYSVWTSANFTLDARQ